MARARMNELGVKSPKKIHADRIIKVSRILLWIWIPVTIVLLIRLGLMALIISCIAAIIYTIFVLSYFTRYQKKVVTAYKALEVPKEMYLKELMKNYHEQGKKRDKVINRYSKLWDKTKDPREVKGKAK